MKKAFLLTIIINFFLVALLYAGGSHYEAEILEFKTKGNDEFVMVLKQYTEPYGTSDNFKPRKIIIHLQYKSKMCKREDYLRAVNLLIEQFKKGGKFYFGVMANGYIPIAGKKNEYQSNRLEELEEYDGRKVVCSFAN